MNPVLLANSLGLMAAATLVALALGLPVALAMQLAGARFRRSLVAATLLVLALPAFFVAGMWMDLIGFAGAWRDGAGWATDRLLPLGASTWVLALLVWPITTLSLAGAWDRLDIRWLEMEPALRGVRLVRTVLWPMVRPALWRPAAITAVLALGNFSVPALFQARVWPAEVWVEFSTRFDAGAALARCWPLVPISAGLVALALRAPVAWPVLSGSDSAELLRQRLGPRFSGAVLGAAAMVLGLSLALPVGMALAATRTWSEFGPAAQAAAPAALRSVAYAATAATLVVVLGIIGSGRRWCALSALVLVLPGVFTGIALQPVGGWPGLDGISASGGLVVLALTLRYAFVGWYAAHWARRAADPRLLDLARMSGAGGWTEWRHVIAPQAGRVLPGAWFVVYLLSLWDVETLILLVPPGGDSLALVVFNLLHYGHNAQVTALCGLLGLLAVLPLALWEVSKWLVRPNGPSGIASAIGGGHIPRPTRPSPLLPSDQRRVGREGCLNPSRCGVVLLGLALSVTGCGPADRGDGSAALASDLFERVEVIGGRGTGPGLFVKPRSVAVDGDDNVYVVDMTGRVQKFSPEGRWLLLWQMPQTDKGRPKGMDTAPDGGVLVVEPHYHRVNLFSPAGQLRAQWGVAGTNAGELWFPRAIAVARDGDCHVSEYGRVERVQRFRADGSVALGRWGEPGTGPGQLNRAEGLGVDSAGNVFVADSCNHRVQVFAPDGRFLRMHGRAGRGLGEFSYPYDVRIDRDGRQYVCEFGNSRVQVLDAQDRPLETLGGPGTAPGRMNNPWGLCLDSRANLYVADAMNHRVLKFVRRTGAGGGGGAE